MKHPSFLPALVAGFCLAAGPASAALVLHVDTSTQEYYFEGSATGTPQLFFGQSVVTWDNGQALGGELTENIFSAAMFESVSGETLNAEAFLHSNGNLTGNVGFFGEVASLTISGNATVRASYAAWNPALVAEFVSKAALAETVASATDSSFNITFATVPEPASSLLGLAGAWTSILRRRRTV